MPVRSNPKESLEDSASSSTPTALCVSTQRRAIRLVIVKLNWLVVRRDVIPSGGQRSPAAPLLTLRRAPKPKVSHSDKKIEPSGDPTDKSSGYSNKPHRRFLFSPRDTRRSAYCANVYIDVLCIRFSHRICRLDVRLSNWESSEIGETRRLTLSPASTILVYPHSTRL